MAFGNRHVRVCHPDKLECPRCEAPQRRVYGVGATVGHCDTKIRRGGSNEWSRCGTYLLITPITASVSTVTALASRDEAESASRELRAALYALSHPVEAAS